MKRWIAMGSLAAGLALTTVAAQAVPIFAIAIKHGATTDIIVDNGAGDTDSAIGSIVVSSPAIPDFDIGSITADYTTGPGGLTIDLSGTSINKTSLLAGDLFVGATIFNLLPGSTNDISVTGAVTGNNAYTSLLTRSSTDAQLFIDPTNTPFGLNDLLLDSGTLTTRNYADNSSGAISGVTGPISTTLLDTLSYKLGSPNKAANFSSTATGKATAVAVPEPSSIALLGSGLLGILFFGRRRKRANASIA